MPPRPRKIPAYRLHKPTGQAVVRLDGRDVYLGLHGTEASQEKYRRTIAEWLSNKPVRPRRDADVEAMPDAFTIGELILRYLKHADTYYMKNGQPTKEPIGIRLALRPLRKLYGRTPARDFGPRALKTVRQDMIDSGLCRNEVNKRVGKIKRAFKWAVSEELIPSSVVESIRTVDGLRRGRAEVRESEPVRPVPETFVDAIEPYTSRQVWAMVQLQRLTAMRPGEVVSMRSIDIDTTGRIWTYTPAEHKTEHHGRRRTIFLGPQAQDVLRPWLRPELEACLFSPMEATAERRAKLRLTRKTPVQPSQRNRSKARPRKRPGHFYTTESYRRAIKHAIARANRERSSKGESVIPDWHPHQLRHNAATRLRKEFGLDVARAILGHSSPVVTEVYAERDASLAIRAMEKIG